MKNPPIENKIYISIIGFCEDKESNGQYKGNGHHLAQKLSTLVASGLLPNQQRLIFESLTETPIRVSEISRKLNIPSKHVSSQLNQIYNSTLLIGFNKNGRIKYWYKN
jgi:hypothetical protein